MVAGPALPAEAKDVLAEYQRRADAVNKRLNTASEWLRRGLLAEAIAYVEQFPDALEAAKDLELGRSATEALRERCLAQLMDSPAGLDMHVAWELNAAYVAIAAVGPPLGRYRAACLRADSAKRRLVHLREACVALAGTRAELGPLCDSIERSLTRQAHELVAQRISELARLADDLKSTDSSRGSTPDTHDQRKADSSLEVEYKQLVTIIQTLNDFKADLKLDYSNHSELRKIATKQDEIVLGNLLDEAFKEMNALVAIRSSDQPDQARLQRTAETLKACLFRIDGVRQRLGVKLGDARVGEKGVPVPPVVLKAIEDAPQIVREIEEQQNEVINAQKQLRTLLETRAGSVAELKTLYDVSSRGGLTIPDELNLAYQTRIAEIQREARARRGVMLLRSGAVALALAIVAGTIGLIITGVGGSQAKADIPKLIRDAATSLEDGNFEIAWSKLYGQPTTSEGDDKAKPALTPKEFADQREAQITALPEGKQVHDRLKLLKGKAREFGTELAKLVTNPPTEWSEPADNTVEPVLKEGIGRSLQDDKAADYLLALTARQDGNWLGQRRETFAHKVKEKVVAKRKAVEDLETRVRTQSQSLERAFAVLKLQEATKGPKWLLDEYQKQIDVWLTGANIKRAEDLAPQVSDEAFEDLVQPFQSLVKAKDELSSRVELMQSIADQSQTFAGFIELQVKYAGERTLLRSPDLTKSLEQVKTSEDLFRRVASAIDAFSDGLTRPTEAKVAAARAAACVDDLAPIFPGVPAEDRADLGLYCKSYASLLSAPNELRLDDLQQLFEKDLWRQLGSKRDVNGKVFYSLDGRFVSQDVPGWYSLTRCVGSNREFVDTANATKILELGSKASGLSLRLDDLELGPIASIALDMINSAKDMGSTKGARFEPLTIGPVIAQKIMTSKMPSPLKRSTLDKLLSLHRKLDWPSIPEAAKLAERVRTPGQGLDDAASWTHDPAEASPVRDAQISFERFLTGVPNLETAAKDRFARVEATSWAMSASRFFGVAWPSAPEGVLRKELPENSSQGTLYVIAVKSGRVEMREVGRVGDAGAVVWTAAPSEGTPLIVRRSIGK